METTKLTKKFLEKLPVGSKYFPIKYRTSTLEVWGQINSETDKQKLDELITGSGHKKLSQKLFGSDAIKQPLLFTRQNGTLELGDWFINIKKGKDRLRDFGMGELYDKAPELEKYGMTSPTDTGLTGSGQILELRALKRKIPYTGWSAYMQEIADIVSNYAVEEPKPKVEDWGGFYSKSKEWEGSDGDRLFSSLFG